MRFISCDQSTSHCALVFWEDNVIVGKHLIKTVSSHAATKPKGAIDFPIITNQLNYVAYSIVDKITEFGAEHFVYESPAQGSYGDAKSVLIVLFRTIRETIQYILKWDEYKISSYAPTAVKAYARNFLPIEEQREIKRKLVKIYEKDPKTKKKVVVREEEQDVEILTEMSKKRMIQACNLTAPSGWISSLTLTEGKSDFADAFFIGHMHLNKKIPTQKKCKNKRDIHEHE